MKQIAVSEAASDDPFPQRRPDCLRRRLGLCRPARLVPRLALRISPGARATRRLRPRPANTFMTDATAPRVGLMQSAWANPILLLVLTTLIWGAHSIVGRLPRAQSGPTAHVPLRW